MDKIKSISFTLLSILSVLIPITMMGIWIHAFGLSDIQAERVEIYNSFLPKFMENTRVSTLISIAFCLAAISFSIPYFKSSNPILKGIKIVVAVTGSCILLLNVFSLL